MATFSITGVDANNFLNIYNNNVVNIDYDGSPETETANYLRVTVTRGVESAEFQVTQFTTSPEAQLFTFNLKEVFKSLVSDAKNRDLKTPISQVVTDGGLLQEYSVQYGLIHNEPELNNYYNYTYKAFKSVEQIGETIVKPITDPYILSNYNITMFKGYPFDFSLYTDAGSMNIVNLTNGNSIHYPSVGVGVNRVFLSRGEYLLDEIDEYQNFVNRVANAGGTLITNPCYSPSSSLPILNIGYNNIQIESGSFTSQVLKVRLIDACEGVYLKWFNEKGAWSYWLFNNIHKDKISSRVIDVYNTDFDSIEQTYFPSLITGKEAENTLDLIYNALDDNEYNQVKSVITSPRVELFIGNKDDDYSLSVANGGADYAKAWMGVRVLNGTITKSNKIGFNDIKISIDKKKYTQS